jgi:hypothetical protein
MEQTCGDGRVETLQEARERPFPDQPTRMTSDLRPSILHEACNRLDV